MKILYPLPKPHLNPADEMLNTVLYTSIIKPLITYACPV